MTMRDPIEIGSLTVQPGTRAAGWIEVARSPMQSPIGIPLVVVHGSEPGRTLVVDAGVHGDEHEGILALHTLIRDLDPQKMRGTLLACPIVNGGSYEARMRGNPMEIHYYDLNRSFPGDPLGSITQRLAHAYFHQVVKRGDLHMSLHGGGDPFYLNGFVIAHGVSGGDRLDLVRAVGWERVADAPDHTTRPNQGTIHDVCDEAGIPSVTLEMGGASHRSPQQYNRSVQEILRALRNVMIHFGMVDGELARPDRLFRIKRTLVRANNGGLIEFADDIEIDAPVKKDQVLLRIYGPLGDLVEECKAPFDGYVMGLPGSGLAYPGRIVASVYDNIGEV